MIIEFFMPWVALAVTIFLMWLMMKALRLESKLEIGVWLMVLVAGLIKTYDLSGVFVITTFETVSGRFLFAVIAIVFTFVFAYLLGIAVAASKQNEFVGMVQLWACAGAAFLSSSAAYHWMRLFGEGFGNMVLSVIVAIVALILAYLASQFGDAYGNPESEDDS